MLNITIFHLIFVIPSYFLFNFGNNYHHRGTAEHSKNLHQIQLFYSQDFTQKTAGGGKNMDRYSRGNAQQQLFVMPYAVPKYGCILGSAVQHL